MLKALRTLLLAVLVVPTLATAQVSLGLRASYAFPAGDAYENSGFGTFKESDLAKGAVPLQVDASWRFSKTWSAGLYYSYAFGQAGSKLKDLCSTPGASCDNPSFVRYGVNGAYNFGPQGSAEPWLGLALGIEQAAFKVKNFTYGFIPPATVLTADLDGTLRGWEAQLEGGADFRVSPGFVAGPFLALSVGQYRVQEVKLSDQGTVASGGVDNPKTHEWFSIGVRGRFDL
jgi:hypothetical protein